MRTVRHSALGDSSGRWAAMEPVTNGCNTELVTAHVGQGPEDDSQGAGEHVRVHESGHAIVGHSVGLVVDHVIGKISGHVSARSPFELTEHAKQSPSWPTTRRATSPRR